MRNDDLTPWKPGDPVGMGQVYLPDSKTRKAYGDAVRAQWLEAAAVAVTKKRTLQERRDLINSYPEEHRDQLKAKVAEIWRKAK